MMGDAMNNRNVLGGGLFGTSFISSTPGCEGEGGRAREEEGGEVCGVSDSKALSLPNLNWASWALNLSMDFFDLVSSLGNSAELSNNPAAVESILGCSSQAYSARTLAALLNCSCNSHNIASRVLSLGLIARLVRTQRRRLELELAGDGSSGGGSESAGGSKHYNVIISTRHEQKLARLIAERVVREANFAPVVTADPSRSKDCGLLHRKLFGVGETGEGSWGWEENGSSAIFAFLDLDAGAAAGGGLAALPDGTAAATASNNGGGAAKDKSGGGGSAAGGTVTPAQTHPRGLGSSYICGLVNVLSHFILIREKKKKALKLSSAGAAKKDGEGGGSLGDLLRVHVDEVRPVTAQVSRERSQRKRRACGGGGGSKINDVFCTRFAPPSPPPLSH
jgi:hypothetical protein